MKRRGNYLTQTSQVRTDKGQNHVKNFYSQGSCGVFAIESDDDTTVDVSKGKLQNSRQ